MIRRKFIGCLGALVLLCLSVAAQNQDWLWAYGGGSTASDDAAYGIARDANGFVYITGTFRTPGYFGDDTLTGLPFGGNEVLVSKQTSQGTWGWAVRGGGLGFDEGHGIALGVDGSVYVSGKYNGSAYPHADFGIHTLTGDGSFVGKLNQSGAWMAVHGIDGYAYDIAVDVDGNCYVAGFFLNTATFGATTLTSAGDYDIYIAKLSTSGIWQWAVRAGAPSTSYLDERGTGIALDPDGNVYVTGYFCGNADFGSTTLSATNNDIFIAKLDNTGNWLWARKAGGSSADKGYDIAVDDAGNSYVTGACRSGWFGSINITTSGIDAFAAKLDTNGNFLWAKKGGGASTDEANGIALDALGNSYITGYFTRNATFGTTVLNNVSDSNDIFVAKLDTSGNWVWATRSGGSNSEIAQAIVVDPSGTCYITGAYYGNTSFGSNNLSSTGGQNFDIFVAALGVVAPLDPENLQITKSGSDILLQWDEVTHNTLGTFITPSYYNVYYSSDPDTNSPVTLLDSVTGTSCTHIGGALGAEKRFYNIKAVLAD